MQGNVRRATCGLCGMQVCRYSYSGIARRCTEYHSFLPIFGATPTLRVDVACSLQTSIFVEDVAEWLQSSIFVEDVACSLQTSGKRTLHEINFLTSLSVLYLHLYADKAGLPLLDLCIKIISLYGHSV